MSAFDGKVAVKVENINELGVRNNVGKIASTPVARITGSVGVGPTKTTVLAL